MSVTTNPEEIEAKSFQIIDRYLTNVRLPELEKEVAKRVVHATADLNYAKGLIFHPLAVKAGLSAIMRGKNVIADANMLKAGINKKALSGFGGSVFCLIDDKDIIRQSHKLKLTRTMLAMRKAAGLMEEGIAAVGNAPTALFELCDLVEKGTAKPALIIGIPVGFVGAKESKKKLRTLRIPYITNVSRKGGSSVVAAVMNALLKIAERGEICKS